MSHESKAALTLDPVGGGRFLTSWLFLAAAVTDEPSISRLYILVYP